MSFTYDDFLWINFNKNLSMDNFKTGRSCQDSLEALIYEISELETSIINDPNLTTEEISAINAQINDKKNQIKLVIPGIIVPTERKINYWKISITSFDHNFDDELNQVEGDPSLSGSVGYNFAICKNQLVNNYKDNYYENFLNSRYNFFSPSETLYTKEIYLSELNKANSFDLNFTFKWYPENDFIINAGDKISIKIFRNEEYSNLKANNINSYYYTDNLNISTTINWKE